MSKVSANWKKVSEKILVDNKYISIWEEDVLQPNGKIATYYVNRRTPYSVIIPMKGDTLYMVKQFRYPVNTISLEFPMGHVEGKSPLETAQIELLEETGIQAGELVEIGKFWVAPGRSSQWAYVYVAKDLSFHEAQPEEGEFFELEKYTFAEIRDMIAKGKILDATSIVAYHYLENYLKQ